MTAAPRTAAGQGPWSAARFALSMAAAAVAGLAGLWAAAPGRPGLMTAAAAGAAFGCATSIAGYALIARQAAISMAKAVQVFLAVMTVKVLAFAAFLLTIAFTTSLNPAALAGGLAGTTLVGEALAITSLRRVQAREDGPGRGGGADGLSARRQPGQPPAKRTEDPAG